MSERRGWSRTGKRSAVAIAAVLATAGVALWVASRDPDDPSAPIATGTAASEVPARPTYRADIAPIIATKCTGCHTAGGIAPFALTEASQVRDRANAIAAVTAARTMPPWQPGPDSPRFVGQDTRQLTPEEIESISRWAASGTP